MKKLIFICGPNGVGKSTTCKALVKSLEKSAYIDSDWCRVMNPFDFTPETVDVIKSNISTMMINYFKCSIIDNVIFSYGFHGQRKEIFNNILLELDKHDIDYEFCPLILNCDLAENIKRMKEDSRDDSRIERAIKNTRTIYDDYDYPRINTTNLSVKQTVDKIIDIIWN